jgi:hypothetical protein
LCHGTLAPPELVTDYKIADEPNLARPDYVCVACHQPFWWRGNPPRLVGLIADADTSSL